MQAHNTTLKNKDKEGKLHVHYPYTKWGNVLNKPAVVILDETGKVPAEQIPVTEITVDDELSAASENPVQNKVITKAIGDIGVILDDINGEVV